MELTLRQRSNGMFVVHTNDGIIMGHGKTASAALHAAADFAQTDDRFRTYAEQKAAPTTLVERGYSNRREVSDRLRVLREAGYRGQATDALDGTISIIVDGGKRGAPLNRVPKRGVSNLTRG